MITKLSKLNKKVCAFVLVLAMVVGALNPLSVGAASFTLDLDDTATYALVASDSKKAVTFKQSVYSVHGSADGVYIEDGDKIGNTSALGIIKSTNQGNLQGGEVRVDMYSTGLGDNYPIRAEGENNYIFADGDKRTDQHEYILEPVADNEVKIRDTAKNWYLGLTNTGEIERVKTAGQAAIFKLVKDAAVTDFTVYIEHKATGKYIKFDGTVNNPVLVNGEADENGNISDDMRFEERINADDNSIINFKSKKYNLCFNSGKDGGKKVTEQDGDMKAGWESIKYQPNGDGTISFRETSGNNKLITVTNGEMVSSELAEPTDNEKFIIHTAMPTEAVTGVKVSKVEDTTATVSWDALKGAIYSGYKVVVTPKNNGTGKAAKEIQTKDNKVDLTELEKGTEYTVQVYTVKGDAPQTSSEEVEMHTKDGPRPVVAKADMKAVQDGKNIKVSWNAIKDVTEYDVYRAQSAFASNYEKIGTTSSTEYVDKNINSDKYKNYYKLVARNKNGDSSLSEEYTSLETTKFGKNMIFIAPTDNIDTVNKVVQEIFKKQNNSEAAQFNSGHYAIYYKPGNYVATACIPVGFYTHIGGLGKTPYDVKLNNIEVPAYLDYVRDSKSYDGRDYWGDQGGNWRNATCNFWRSAENISVVGTGDATVAEEVTDGRSLNNKKDYFNWSVAQAAPLRRVYSTRKTSYDWSYGWNSGGYAADCYFASDACSPSQQQWFTRNSVIKGSAAGTSLNNFNIGVDSASLPNDKTGTALLNGNGYTDWNIATDGTAGVTTSITKTPESKEKPFLFLDDDGEYKVFVPSLRKNTKGISWSETDMGEGQVMSLDKFYIAKEGDTAAKINEELDAGKNIFFTPGQYDADEVIKINNPDTIVLGTGMATIVADNKDAAIEVADVDGITVSGLVFDAGTKAKSKYLLKVGEEKTDKRHNDNPTLLQDLFFRVGGTTNQATTAENALVINSNDVINDHFWIWRADHGAGVAWENTRSDYGMIVNGDHVHMYGLFDEHFNKNDVLWNGEYGATYFLQNEKCYDPISQEAWMSHEGLVNGYSAYKVSNKVKHHYAVGMGIYNVFIYTGPTYDSSEVQIQLDNPIEVPNTEDVLIENACTQTFAKDDGVLQKFNHIINDVGESVSSGIDKNTGTKGEGWARKHILNYRNGICNRGTNYNKIQETGLNPYNEKGDVDITELVEAYEDCDDKLDLGKIYTKETFDPYEKIMDEIQPIYKNFKQEQEGGKYIPHRLTQKEVSEKAKEIRDTYAALAIADADYTDLDKALAEAKIIRKSTDYKGQYYTKDSKKAFDEAYKVAKALADARDDGDILTAPDQDKLTKATKDLVNAMDELVIDDADLTPLKKALDRADKIIAGNNYKNNKYVPATKEFFDYYYGLGKDLYDQRADLDKRSQALIEARAANVNAGIDQLLLLPANTGDLEKLIKYAEENIRDGEYFQNEYYINVAKFLDYLNKARMVIKDANINDQDTIDETYQDLYDAIISLKLKPADYERLNQLRQEALDIVASDNYKNDRYTLKTVTFFNDEHQVAKLFSNDYMIPDQKVVDEEADKLDYAIKQLRLKDDGNTDPTDPSNPDKPNNPSNPSTPSKPTNTSNTNKNNQSGNKQTTTKKSNALSKVLTGDNQQILGYVLFAGVAFVAFVVLKRKKAH